MKQVVLHALITFLGGRVSNDRGTCLCIGDPDRFGRSSANRRVGMLEAPLEDSDELPFETWLRVNQEAERPCGCSGGRKVLAAGDLHQEGHVPWREVLPPAPSIDNVIRQRRPLPHRRI